MRSGGKIFLTLLFLLSIGAAGVFGYAMWQSDVANAELKYKDELSKSRLFNQSAQQTITELLSENEELKREINKLKKENERLIAEIAGDDDLIVPPE